MFEQDYLMKLLLAFYQAMFKACDVLPTRTKIRRKRPIRLTRSLGTPLGWTAPACCR